MPKPVHDALALTVMVVVADYLAKYVKDKLTSEKSEQQAKPEESEQQAKPEKSGKKGKPKKSDKPKPQNRTRSQTFPSMPVRYPLS